MTTEVLWYNGQRGSWCASIVEWLTKDFTHRMDCEGSHVRGDGAIVIVKADQITNIDVLNDYLKGLGWLLLIVTANEDGTWQWDRFRHPNSLVWLQTPHASQHASRFLPWGWTPNCPERTLPWKDGAWRLAEDKSLDWFFSGQITHSRREECFRWLSSMFSRYRCELHATFGFAQGVAQKEYFKSMLRAKVAPCPSGPVTVDSLRVCEALRLGAIPVLDAASPRGPYPEYWKRVFGDHPLEIIEEWSYFPAMLTRLLGNWEERCDVVQKWWANWQVSLRLGLNEDLKQLGAL